MTTILKRDPDAILAFLSASPATFAEIVTGTGFDIAFTSVSIKQLRADNRLHVGSWTPSGVRFIRVFAAGPGVDAEKPHDHLAMTTKVQPILDLLSSGDMMRTELSAKLKWSAATTRLVLNYMQDHDLIEVGSTKPDRQNVQRPAYRAYTGTRAPRKATKRPTKPSDKPTRIATKATPFDVLFMGECRN